MSDAALAGARRERERIEAVISGLDAKLARSKAQLAEIDEFVDKYNKFSAVGRDKAEINGGENEPQTKTGQPHNNSKKEDVAVAARRIIEGLEGGISRADLFAALQALGLKISGKDPEMVLSTMLWRAGKEFGVVRLKAGGYTLAERVPNDGNGVIADEEPN